MATELERLVVSLEASITKYEKAMQKAVTVSNSNAKKVEARWNKLNLGQEAFAGFSKGAIATAAGFLSVSAAINGTKAALKAFGDIADKSAAAGLDAEFFQGIAYQAKLSGIEISETASAMATFNKLSGQAVEGRGKLVAQLRAEHPELLKSIQLATTQEQRVRLVADAIKDAKNQSEAAAIAAAAFGDTGVQLVAAFQGGSAAIDETLRKAHELGLIVDRELVARADELGDQLDTVSQVVDLKVKKSLVELGPVLIKLIDLAGGLADALVDAKNLAEHPGDFLDVLSGSTHAANDLARLQKQLRDELGQAALSQGLGLGDQSGGIRAATMGFDSSTSNDIGGGLDRRDFETWFDVRLASAIKKSSVSQVPLSPVLVPERGLGNEGKEGGHGREGQLSGDADNVQATAKATADLADSLDRVGESVTADNSAFEDLQQQVETATQLGQQFANTFIDDLLNGKDVISSIGDALGDLGRQLLQMGTNAAIQSLFSNLFGIASGGGPTGGTFGNGLWGSAIFGGGRAAGGPVEAGKVYKINENTPNSELWMPTSSGIVLPKMPKGGAAAGAAAAAVRVDIVVQDDGTLGAIARSEGARAAQLTIRREVPGMIRSGSPAAVAKAQYNRLT